MQIVFLPNETDDRLWWVIWLRAMVEDRPVMCGISYQALRDHFGADFGAPVRTFCAHRSAIERLMAQFITQQGHIVQHDSLVMRSQDVRGVRP